MVAILMSTYNGEKYLKEQINSILHQSEKQWNLFIRDDGSTDKTREIVQEFCSLDERIKFISGQKNLGASLSFFELLKSIDSEYYMFCDQDDFWLDHKVSSSLSFIKMKEKENKSIPILCYADCYVVNKNLEKVSDSFMKESGLVIQKFRKKEYLLMKNFSPGCTYIFNRSAVSLITKMKNVPMHDWAAMLSVSRAGLIFFMTQKHLLYRQHETNVIGVEKFNISNVLNKIFLFKKTLKQQKKQYIFLKENGFVSSQIYYYWLKIKNYF